MRCRPTTSLLLLLAVASTAAQTQQTKTGENVDWPVYQGDHDHTHYTTLCQISPANVAKLQVAWTYDTRYAFPGSEMQSNPIIVGGVLYAMSPKQRAFALDAATGRELWSFDPTGGQFTGPRIRYRGVVVHDGRVYFNYRHRLFALDARTGHRRTRRTAPRRPPPSRPPSSRTSRQVARRESGRRSGQSQCQQPHPERREDRACSDGDPVVSDGLASSCEGAPAQSRTTST